MSATTQPQTLADLRRDFLARVRGDSSDTTTAANADRYLNIALHDMHITTPMPWAERRAVLLTRAPYTTGTVSLTTATSRTALTGTSTLWTTTDSYGIANARQGGKLKLGNSEVYEVQTVGGAGAITLTSQYTGTDLSADTYTYFEDEYSLASDFLRPLDLRSFADDATIPLIGKMQMRRWYPRNDVGARPQRATLIQLGFSTSTTARYRIVLAPYPDQAYSIPYSYVTTNLAVTSAGVEQTQLSSDDDEPIVPLRYRHVLTLHALYHWYRDRKDDGRTQLAKGEYEQLMTRILADLTIGQDRPKFFVRHPTRFRRGRFDINERFDRLADR